MLFFSFFNKNKMGNLISIFLISKQFSMMNEKIIKNQNRKNKENKNPNDWWKPMKMKNQKKEIGNIIEKEL